MAKRPDYQTDRQHDQLFIGRQLSAALAHAIVKLFPFHPVWFRLITPSCVKHLEKKQGTR